MNSSKWKITVILSLVSNTDWILRSECFPQIYYLFILVATVVICGVIYQRFLIRLDSTQPGIVGGGYCGSYSTTAPLHPMYCANNIM